MSVATPFATLSPFPFCVPDMSASPPSGSAFVGNLTLAQVMAFAWNLETFTLTTTGSATSGALVADGNCTFTLSPIASSRFTKGSLEGSSMMFDGPVYPPDVVFSSWPEVRQPRARVCMGSDGIIAAKSQLLFAEVFDGAAGVGVAQLEIGFWISIDPSNLGKYRIYYIIGFNFSDPTTETVELIWQANPTSGGLTQFANGTITIAGITFNWYALATTGATTTGGTLTASGTSFTYP